MKRLSWSLVPLLAAALGCTAPAEKAAAGKEKDEKKDAVSISAGDAQVKVTGEGGVKIEAGGVKIEVPGGLAGVAMGGSGTASETEKEIVIATTNQVSSYECKNRSVRIKGSSNAVTLTGECREVLVDGVGNVVVLDAVESITVEGTGNGVKWKRALGGQTPKIRQSGVANVVAKADADEE